MPTTTLPVPIPAIPTSPSSIHQPAINPVINQPIQPASTISNYTPSDHQPLSTLNPAQTNQPNNPSTPEPHQTISIQPSLTNQSHQPTTAIPVTSNTTSQTQATSNNLITTATINFTQSNISIQLTNQH
jgi:hypothetical protein